ncbi:MAG: hypothetical protein WD027_03995 [Gaiellales bacterium]
MAGALVRKDFHTVHLAGPNDSFLTELSYFLFDVNFILADFVVDRYVPDTDDHRDLAKIAYIDALTGRQFELAQIDRFKSLLVASKIPTWEMDERMERLRQDEIGTALLEMFLDRSEHRLFFVHLLVSNGKTPPEDVLHPTRRERLGFLRK